MSNTGPKSTKPKAGRPKKIREPDAPGAAGEGGDTSASDLAE